MEKFEIEAIKRKKQQADNAEQKRRYNIACEIAIARKQKFDATRKEKKQFKTKHLLASFSLGLVFGVTVMFFLPSILEFMQNINDKNIVVSKSEEIKSLSTQFSVDPQTLQHQGLVETPDKNNAAADMPNDKKEISQVQIRVQMRKNIRRDKPYPLFSNLQQTNESPEDLKKRKIKEIQDKVRKAAKKRKTIRKNKKKRIVKQEKKQESRKQEEKHSLPPDIRAEMMGQ